MNALKNIILFAVVILGLSSCGPTLTPFTQRLYQENAWSESELKRIQFYLSDNIVLRRQVSGGTSEIISGEIKIVDGQKVEEIVFRKGTPGVLLFTPKKKRFAISFEENGEESFLMFGPNPKVGNRYVLLASEWKRRRGKVTYEGKKFDVNGGSAISSLMVDLKKIRKVAVKSRQAGGRRING